MTFATPLAIAGWFATGLFAYAARRAAGRCGIAFDLGAPMATVMFGVGTLAQSIVALHAHDARGGCVLAFGLSAAIVCAVSDAATGYVFDAVTLPAIAGAFAAGLVWPDNLAIAAGALAAGGALATLWAVTRGRGIGLGDVKLAACIGAALGASDAMLALGVAFVAGGVQAALLLVTRRAGLGGQMRFAPYLAGGMMAVALCRTWR